MALANRVKETWIGTGTGTVSLAGAVANFQTFVAGLGSSTGDTSGPWTSVPYLIILDSAGEWEMGVGTVTDGSPDTLTRSAVDSSNSGSLIDFSSGTKIVALAPGAANFGSTIRIVRLKLNADESIASGTAEQLTNITAVSDTASLFSSNTITVPFNGIMLATSVILTASGQALIVPVFDIDGTLHFDPSAAEAGAPGQGTFNPISAYLPVTSGQEVEWWAHNLENDAANTALGDASVIESYADFVFIST